MGGFYSVFLRFFLVFLFSVGLAACVEFPSYGGCAMDDDCGEGKVCREAECVGNVPQLPQVQGS